MTSSERSALEERLRAREAELVSLGPVALEPATRDPSRSAADEDEAPLAEMLQAIASGRNRSHDAELVLVRRALFKLREAPESYGLCESCDEEVATARLRAQPHARLCVTCQSGQDAPVRGTTRRRLTDYR